MIVTLEEIKQHLYIDFEADNDLLSSMIEAAESIIEKYLNTSFDSLTDDKGNIPTPIKQAIKIMVGNLYTNRESVSFNAYPSKIPYSFEYLIQPFKNYSRK